MRRLKHLTGKGSIALRVERANARRCIGRNTYKKLLSLFLILFLTACGPSLTGDRYYDLPELAKAAVYKDLGNAKKLANELLVLASERKKDWNYGNAIHFGNMVLGQVALREGKLDLAEEYLLKSGATPGSPQLDTFGPNMSLAKELLEAERSEAVLEYFELCGQFWEMSGGKLEIWAIQVERGEVPDFGANLVY